MVGKKTLLLVLFYLVTSISIFGQQSISGITWIDKDQDGIRNISDTTLAQVKVELFTESGFMIQFTNSDNQGNYSFQGLTSGKYYLKFIKKTGLKLTLRNVGNDEFDSDILQTGFSQFIDVNNNNPNPVLDAGFRTSLSIRTSNLITGCQGTTTTIAPEISGYSGTLTYHWSHDNSSGSTSTIMLTNSLDIILTVYDEWNLPVTKKILVKVTDGIGVSDCTGIDLFDQPSSEINIFVNEDDPGPISQTDSNPSFLGGERKITLELLDGENISSVNSSSNDLFISNCSGCRTSTTFNYYNPNGDFLDLSFFEYILFNDILLDQGNIDITITLIGQNTIAAIDGRLESEGSTNEFDKIFPFASFSNSGIIDLATIQSVEINMITTNVSIDFTLGGIASCFDRACEVTLDAENDICLGESAILSPVTDCEDALIFQWVNIGFGKEQTVSPIDTTTYTLNVFDQNGCSQSYTTTVNVAPPPTLSISAPLTACNDEEITIEADAMGNGPFSFDWSISSENTSSIDIVVSGNTFIAVTVTDVNGCQDFAQQLVTGLEKPSILLSTTDSKCSTPTGSITANITGGAPPYTINWSNGANNQTTLNNIDGGLYEVEVVDANGCTVMESASVEYLPCAQIGNYVWHDVDVDGIQSASDEPIEGVVVVLFNGLGQELMRDTTDALGEYLFVDLEEGDYYVEFVTPDCYYPTIEEGIDDISLDSDIDAISFTSDIVTLGLNEKNLTLDAGLYKKVCIGDQVWNDINLNDNFDAQDIGIEDILVKLYDCDELFIDSIRTGSDGTYQFCNLEPGSYSVSFCDHDGYMPVTQNVGDDDVDSDIDEESSSTECKTLMSGDTINSCDAGFILYSSIGDYVWEDVNVNGLQDNNEPPISGVLLNLYTCDSAFITSTTTDEDGIYLFDSLVPVNYYVEVVLLPNMILTSDSTGINSAIDNDFIRPSNSTTCIDLPMGTHIPLIDAGIYFLASIGDYAWEDSDLDGFQDPNEEPIEGQKIYLNSCDSVLLDSTYTDADGYYLFDSLVPSGYYISVELQDGQSFTTTGNNDDVTNNDINPNTLSSTCRTLSSGENNEDLDVGIYFLGKIGDFVWYDINGNGVQEATEEGVPDLVIYLMDCDNNVLSTTQTDDAGNYCFENIPYGDYIVQFDVPEPYFLVNNNGTTNNAIDSDPDPSTQSTDCITVDSPLVITIDAGITTCSTIGGIAWFDIATINDIQDPFENGVNGIFANVYQAQGNDWVLIGSDITGLKPGTASEDGYWEMCVPPGDYYVQFSYIPVLDVVMPNVGSDEEVDSDAVHVFGTNTTDIITVEPGEDITNIGMGYKWKTSNKAVSRYMSDKKLPAVRQIENGLPVFEKSTSKSRNTKVEHKVTAHPNPTNGIVYLTSETKGELTYSLYNSVGNEIKRPIKANLLDNKRIEISLEDKVSGVYYILVQSENDTQFIPIIRI